MIVPLLTYGCQLHACLNTTKSERLASISTRATQITGNSKVTQCEIGKAIQIKNCLFVRRCLENMNCDIFNHYLKLNEHNRDTRNGDILLLLPKVKLEFKRKGFYFYGAELYNELPRELRKQETFLGFKTLLPKMM